MRPMPEHPIEVLDLLPALRLRNASLGAARGGQQALLVRNPAAQEVVNTSDNGVATKSMRNY